MIGILYFSAITFMTFFFFTYVILFLRSGRLFISKLLCVSCGDKCLSCGDSLNLSPEKFLERINSKSFFGGKCVLCNREFKIGIIRNSYMNFFDKIRTFCLKYSSKRDSSYKRILITSYCVFLVLSIILSLISTFLFPLGPVYKIFLMLYNFTISIHFFIDILAMYFILQIKWTD